MEHQLKLENKTYNLQRYPKTDDNSLKAWSNAELLAFNYIEEKNTDNIHLFNDRFGVWNCLLSNKNTTTIWTYASQQKAIEQNLLLNNIINNTNFKTPLNNLNIVDLALIKIPKSLELFELFLQQIHKASNNKTEVVCCFMTKYFSESYLKIAQKYFNNLTQTKAWKKARLLILNEPKNNIESNKLINKIDWKNSYLQQYYGVFSSKKIDIGTQFLLENLKIKENEVNILDVASGNGIIAFDIVKQNPNIKLTLVDDFNLAIESSKINLKGFDANFICSENLKNLIKNSFDLIVSNPPFHFEYENNIEIALSLFKEVKDCLKENGRFVLVYNKHLNYKTHLNIIFSKTKEIAVNKKFVVCECYK
ncbi:MAG: class I SAM-dependent methyltransferase [Tenacibaculum sp.]|nr:class I SAM-dependent methyltransferase [Tenacibaculum sp.]